MQDLSGCIVVTGMAGGSTVGMYLTGMSTILVVLGAVTTLGWAVATGLAVRARVALGRKP